MRGTVFRLAMTEAALAKPQSARSKNQGRRERRAGIGPSGTIGLGGRCQDSLCGGPQHSQLCQGEEISCPSQELL